MHKFLKFNAVFSLRKHPLTSLFFFWMLGLMLGCICSAASPTALTPLVYSAVSDPPSLPRLLLTVFLPIALSFFAVFFHEYWLLQPIIWGKGFLFAFVATAATAAYGSAGWLVRFLLMFTDCCTLPLLIWYWIQIYNRRRSRLFIQTVLLLVVNLLICALDLRFVSPFLTAVIS